LVPAKALRFVADQVDITPEALAAYAARFQTRYEQLDALRADFGFVGFTPEHRREILGWLLPVALTTTSAATIAATLMDEMRRHRLIVPSRSLVDRLVSAQ
jgi:TnpA family transposase